MKIKYGKFTAGLIVPFVLIIAGALMAGAAQGTPNITSFNPNTTEVTTNAGESITFNITINQTVNATWYINGTEARFNESVSEAEYSNDSSSSGIWNITVVVENTNGTDFRTWDWTVMPSPPTPIYGAPNITGFSPLSPVSDLAGATRIFNITLNQTSNVTWLINGTRVQFNESVTGAEYTNISAAQGTWNVTAAIENSNGTGFRMWNWFVTSPPPPPPVPGIPLITGFFPLSPVTDFVGATRTFNITINQTANVTWLINGTRVQFNESVTDARYTNNSAAEGSWNVTAITQNLFGTVKQVWIWMVSLPAPAAGAPSITGFAPASPVNDITGMARSFNITVNQTANVTWYINGTPVQFNENVTNLMYTNFSSGQGTWILNATASNVNGTDSKEWKWIVTLPSGKIIAEVEIKPETLNLASNGVFTAFISLPGGYNESDIDISTVMCSGASAVKGTIEDGSLVVKFDRQELKDVPAGDAVTLNITGEVRSNGTMVDFEGSDTIRVINQSKGKDDEDTEEHDSSIQGKDDEDAQEHDSSIQGKDDEDAEEHDSSIQGKDDEGDVEHSIKSKDTGVSTDHGNSQKLDSNQGKSQDNGKKPGNGGKKHDD